MAPKLTDQDHAAVTAADWQRQQVRTKLTGRASLVCLTLMPVLSYPALLLAGLSASGTARDLLLVAYMVVIFWPLSYLMYRANTRQQ